MTIAEAGEALRRKSISCRELVDECLSAIERESPRLNAFITVCADEARGEADRLDAELASGADRGPLHGIPIAHKDIICTKDLLTTSGSKLFADYVPDFDATVVRLLHEAGAVMVGKTGLHEMAYGITSANPHFGVIRNPHNVDCTPGGSSGGSGAAVATGMCFMGTGTDTGGSIRIPASFCGIAGLKPTYGRVSRYGVKPLGLSLDHVGPMARTVRDVAVAYNAMAGHDDRDPNSSVEPVREYVPPPVCSVGGIRLGVPRNHFFDGVDDEIHAAVTACAAAAAKRGAQIRPVAVPDLDALNTVSRVILLAEASAVHEMHHHQREHIGADVLALLDQGRLVPATDYVNAQRLRRHFMRDWSIIFHMVDCLLTPTTPIPAPRIGQTTVEIGGNSYDTRLAATRLVRGVNALGLPALSIPCGKTSAGLPIGLQIIGRPFEEQMVLRVGAALEDLAGEC